VSERELENANPYARPADAVREPPTHGWGMVRFLGPSFILIGSIVGSGELILTTTFGATVGFAGLWFILMSCVCKTIIQAELGRYTISSGDTCLEAFDRVPGPRFRASWLVWLYVLWQIPGLITGGAILGSTGQVLSVAFPFLPQQAWALLIALVNVSILLWGRYGLLEKLSLFMVISFSAITIFCAVALQFVQGSVPWEEALQGLAFRVAPLMATAAVGVTVSTFAATGVSGGELMSYTYWCVEKGYARYTGVAEQGEDWTRRARGWVRVMQVDVWLATVIFTLTTAAFFWLGAGILHPAGLVPSDSQMISTIQNIYTRSLGPWAAALFLVGGFFVLYSTVFSGTAGTTRMYADLLAVFKLVEFHDFKRRMKWIRVFTVCVPLIQTVIFALHAQPKSMLIFSATVNGVLIPIVAFTTLWLRYHRVDPRLRPGLLSDCLLWICTFLVTTVSASYLYFKVLPDIAAAFR
jgi:manganese transport protein